MLRNDNDVEFIKNRVKFNICLFTHSQRVTMSLMRKRQGTPFYGMPRDVLKYISRLIDAEYNQNPQSGNTIIAGLLDEVVNGNLVAVKKILNREPYLLLQAGNVTDQAGNIIIRVTPYECALGAGDHEMVETIAQYFTKIEHGEAERCRQYSRYQPYIKMMMSEPGYDFSHLINVFKDASNEAVVSALHCQFDESIPLHAAIIDFRKIFAPRLVLFGMHFNFVNMIQAYDIHAKLKETLGYEGENRDKIHLYFIQIIGFIQRRFPACERLAFMTPSNDLKVNDNKILRKNFLKYTNNTKFPITTDDNSNTGLGFDYGIALNSNSDYADINSYLDLDSRAEEIKKYVEFKCLNLMNIIQPIKPIKLGGFD